MASLYKTIGKRGTTWTVEFFDSDKNRKRIRLGKVAKRQGESIKARVELLVAAKITGTAPDDDTSRWLIEQDQAMREKLAAVGLIDGPKRSTLGPFLDDYMAKRKALVDAGKLKPRTVRNEQRVCDSLIAFFGPKKSLRALNEGDASDFRDWLLTSGSKRTERSGPSDADKKPMGLNEPTVQKQCAVASRFLNDACRRDIILRNPFESVPKANLATKRRAFISEIDAKKVLAELPDAQWKLLFGLARWAGLRVGSEVRQLAWADVDWEQQRILIRSPKTERYEGRETRWIPVFPELVPLLLVRRDEAGAEDTLVLPMLKGRTDAALRKPLQKAIERAGLVVWPKLWVNLRSTRETELAESFPMHVVCQWIGNTQAIAAKHYLQVTDDHFAQATEDLRNQMLRQSRKAAQKRRRKRHNL